MRIHSLQGLRAACITFVVLAHLSRTHNCFHSVVVERYGNLGVRIFLVLSGYLITSQLVKERTTTGGISLKRFYARRAYRIFPAAYVFMIVAIVTHWRLLSASNIVTALTYTVNYCQHGNHVLGHLWSLGVEEQFYLVWPLCLLLFFRNRLWIVGSVIAAGPPFRLLFWMFWGRAGLEHPFPVFMDALAMGAAVALLAPKLKQFQGALASRWFLVVPTATFLLPLIQFWDSGVYQTIGLTALHLGIALSLRHVMERRYWLLNSLPVMWLGAISYSLYLWQQLFLDRWSTAPWAAFPLNILLALSLAAASYHFVKQPGLKLRERFSPPRIPFVVAAQSPAEETAPVAAAYAEPGAPQGCWGRKVRTGSCRSFRYDLYIQLAPELRRERSRQSHCCWPNAAAAFCASANPGSIFSAFR